MFSALSTFSLTPGFKSNLRGVKRNFSFWRSTLNRILLNNFNLGKFRNSKMHLLPRLPVCHRVGPPPPSSVSQGEGHHLPHYQVINFDSYWTWADSTVEWLDFKKESGLYWLFRCATGWSKKTVTCNFFLADLKVIKNGITHTFLKRVHREVLIF